MQRRRVGRARGLVLAVVLATLAAIGTASGVAADGAGPPWPFSCDGDLSSVLLAHLPIAN